MRHRFILTLFTLFLTTAVIPACTTAPAKTPVAPKPETTAILRNDRASYQIDMTGGHGSGVVVWSSGYLLTNHHVACAQSVGVKLWDQKRAEWIVIPATVLHRSSDLDLAVIKVDHEFTDVAVLSAGPDAFVGDDIYNIGYPFQLGKMFTRGYVMQRGYTSVNNKGMRIVNNMLMDLENGPGASGSGIFSERTGDLVGIMRFMSFAGMGPILVMIPKGAVPISQVRGFLDGNRVPYVTGDGVRHNEPAPKGVPGLQSDDASKPAAQEIDSCEPPMHPFTGAEWFQHDVPMRP